jgi:hypothetical protein
MTLGWSVVEKIICIACSNPIGEHSRKELGRCLFRIQGTYIHENFKKGDSQPRELDDK